MSSIPNASQNYFDEYDSHEASLQLIRQGKLLYALNDDLEATNDIIASFYAHAKVEQEGALIFMPHLCAPEDVTIYNFHRQLIDKYETIDEHGNSAPKHDYQFFLSNYQTLLQLKQRCALYISPQLWNDQATEYIRQAHFLHHELRKHEYDADCAYIIYNVFKMGYDSPLCI